MRREPPLTDWPVRPRDAARRALSMMALNATEARVKVLADLFIAGMESRQQPPTDDLRDLTAVQMRPPSPEAVEPPLTEVTTNDGYSPAFEGNTVGWTVAGDETVTGESTADGRPYPVDADGEEIPFHKICQSHHEPGVECPPVSPPLQEGGGWVRSTHQPRNAPRGTALWTREGQPAAYVPEAVEEAIRSEAVEEYLRKSPESIALEASEEIARLQASLDVTRELLDSAQEELVETQAAFKFATEGWRLDKERKRAAEQALKNIRDKSSAPCDGCPDHDDPCSHCIARRALSPSTESPSEEN